MSQQLAHVFSIVLCFRVEEKACKFNGSGSFFPNALSVFLQSFSYSVGLFFFLINVFIMVVRALAGEGPDS